METLLALGTLATIVWCVLLPAFAFPFIKPNARYLDIWMNGVILIGGIACVVGWLVAGAWALETLL